MGNNNNKGLLQGEPNNKIYVYKEVIIEIENGDYKDAKVDAISTKNINDHISLVNASSNPFETDLYEQVRQNLNQQQYFFLDLKLTHLIIVIQNWLSNDFLVPIGQPKIMKLNKENIEAEYLIMVKLMENEDQLYNNRQHDYIRRCLNLAEDRQMKKIMFVIDEKLEETQIFVTSIMEYINENQIWDSDDNMIDMIQMMVRNNTQFKNIIYSMEQAIHEQKEDDVDLYYRNTIQPCCLDIQNHETNKDLDQIYYKEDYNLFESKTSLENPSADSKIVNQTFIQYGYIAKFIENSQIFIQPLN